jgi:hypothetical protein
MGNEEQLYRAYALNSSRERIGRLHFSMMDLLLRFNDISTLTLTGASVLNSLLTWEGSVEVQRGRGTDAPIVFSGKLSKPKLAFSEGLLSRELQCASKLIYMVERLAYPVPSGPPYTASEFDTRYDVAETVMKGYVDDNVGPSASAARQIAGLTIGTDLGRGAVIKYDARFDELMTVLQDVALAGGDIGFDINSDFEFIVYEPEDKTDTVVFSRELGNIEEFEYAVARPTGNYVIVGGDGEGAARTFLEDADFDSVTTYGRIEKLVNAGNSSDSTVLQDRINATLDEESEVVDLVLKTSDIASVQLYEDFWIGTICTAIIDDDDVKLEVPATVREIQITYDSSGHESYQATLATPKAQKRRYASIFSDIKNLKRRMALTERR